MLFISFLYLLCVARVVFFATPVRCTVIWLTPCFANRSGVTSFVRSSWNGDTGLGCSYDMFDTVGSTHRLTAKQPCGKNLFARLEDSA
jgi:hypothetical protein